MNYEEKYKEALERAKKLHDSYNLMHISVDEIEQIFPELAEIEDERIRKQLIDAIKIGRSNSGISFTEEAASRYIAWLEKHNEEEIRKIRKEEYTNGFNDAAGFGKQKERKPAEWSEDELAKRHLEGYIMGREDTMREMKDFIESHFNTNKAREGEDLTDLYYKEYVRNPQPIPTGWGCDGIHCTNPHGDCINCPQRFTTGGTITTPNSASGTSTLKAEG